ncbi:MAG TPA: Xaa-Pro aminopeptidase [Candidatus Saccharibacteria bacterium]|nr:Xaa-Pro aminopeptidase [Candidatus Saccharibacteria bacterium]
MKASFFQYNRAKLAEKLGGGLIVATAYNGMQRQNDMAFGFTQEANFWYLTGIEEPDWKLIVDGTSHKAWLVLPDVSEEHRLFDGVLDEKVAKQLSGVDGVITHDEAQAKMRQLAKKHSVVHTVSQPEYAAHFSFHQNPAQHQLHQELERIFSAVQLCNKELASLRAIKQTEEIVAIEKAVKLTMQAFSNVKQAMPSYAHEYEIEADMSHYFKFEAAAEHAYDPIIAAGHNACTLHYTANSAKLKSGDMVLLDVGARVDGYAADISRTYAKGKASARAQSIHATLESAHRDIVSYLQPGLDVSEYMTKVNDRMMQALKEVNLIKHDDNEALRKYFPHAIGHGLGIDVHDSLGAPRYFKPGMVMTVEPGIYIPDEKLGFRIEDDILITESGVRNLSKGLSTAL